MEKAVLPLQVLIPPLQCVQISIHFMCHCEQVSTYSCTYFSFCLFVLSVELAPSYWSNIFN